MSVQGKHIVITGGGTGVGAAIAHRLAAYGGRISVLGRRLAPLEEVAAATGGGAFSCDVTDSSSLDAALQAARELHGPVAVAVANAGAAASKPFAKMTPADLATMLDVNLVGVFNLWQACLIDMKSAGWGRLLAVSSIAGLKGYAYVSGYCAAKHAVVGMTRAVAQEVARSGITANAICPGYVETPMLDASIANIADKTGGDPQEAADFLLSLNPMKRFIQPDEVAATAAWLCAEGARSVNGQAISINGGEL